MDQSQHHCRRLTNTLAGLSITRLLIICAAFLTAISSFLFLGNPFSVANNSPSAVSGCSNESESIPDCFLSGKIAKPSSPAPEGVARENPTKAVPTTQERVRSPRRAWQQAAADSKFLPGHTFVEICDSSPQLAVSHCQVHTAGILSSRPLTGIGNEQEAESSISGHVISAAGQTLEDVRIVAVPERFDDEVIELTDNLRFWTVTDSLGAYSFSGLPAGEYTVRSARHGPYEPARVTVRTGIDYADLVVPRGMELVLKGQVFGRFDEPLEGVTVFPSLLGQASVQTGLDGRFELPVTVKPGIVSLTLQFQAPGYRDERSRIMVAGYSGTVTEEIEVVMDMVESWTSLEGTVTDDAGRPLAGRRVELRPQVGWRTQSTTTDKAGRYDFAFVESPADYELLVSGGEGFKDIRRAVQVTTSSNAIDLVVEPYQTGAVSGQLVNQDGSPIPDFELVLKNTESRQPNAIVRTDSNGNFEIPAAPAGDLVISSRSTPTVLIKGLHLEPGERVEVPMVLDWGAHAIRGQVVDSTGNPVAASRVILQWSSRDGDFDTQTMRRTTTDPLGRFAFSNLGPGPHSLKVDAPGFMGIDLEYDLRRQGYDLTVRLN